MKKIIVDVEGCDFPEKMVGGCIDAAKAHPDYTIVVVGGKDTVAKAAVGLNNIETVETTDVVTNYDAPARVIRQKPDSSLVKAFTILNEDDDAVGVVSAGSTGAVLTCATLMIGRITKALHRPVVTSLMPTKIDGKLVCIADAGSTMDALPEYMAQYAIMGSVYMRAAFGIESPRVALLSVGTEEKKGDERTKAAHALLKDLPINFVGNVEARDALSGEYDVIVCDGFSGNVLVKSVEGTAKFVMTKLKEAIKSSASAKLGYLFMKKAFNSVREAMDYHRYDGGAFLGVKKLVLKSHGSSNELSVRVSVDRIVSLYENKVIDGIRDGIASTVESREETANEE
ncbi:MAG: phosphate acyltransferase PlsX [Clostridiales bacterium]|nr:phosphate acyltransferase PlsX [Clostridiales bacterium]